MTIEILTVVNLNAKADNEKRKLAIKFMNTAIS